MAAPFDLIGNSSPGLSVSDLQLYLFWGSLVISLVRPAVGPCSVGLSIQENIHYFFLIICMKLGH